MKGKIMLLLLLLAVFSCNAFAESTQQYSKIYLSPFYRNSLVNNQNVTYYVNVNPPDGIGSVLSAIISFDVYMTPSVNFTIWVDNQSCNTKNFYVSTTYAGAGQGRISFDCSNIIKTNKTYEVKLRPSGANTGAIIGWLDLTYKNMPPGRIQISGTEYNVGDSATVFVQVTDEQGIPVQNASCYLDVWYPNTVNSVHNYTVRDAPMIKAEGDDGIYYWDWNIPENATLGVYMLSAKCSYSHKGAFVYSMEGTETNYPSRTVVSGTYTGSPLFLNDFEDWIYTQCSSGGGSTKYCESIYDYNTTVHFGTSFYNESGNITNIDLYYMGEASQKATIIFYVWNWTSNSWITLPNTLTYSGSSSNVPIGVGNFVSNSLPTRDVINKTNGLIRIRYYASYGSTFYLFDNWMNIAIRTIEGTVHEVKGSSEMHISNIPRAVWNYTTRELTEYNNSVLLEKIKNINSTFVNVTINASITDESINYLLEELLARNYFFDYLKDNEKDKNYCIGQNTSVTVRELEICRNSACKSYNATYFSDCIVGCDEKTGKCNESLYRISGWTLIMVIIMVFLVLKAVGF